MDDKDIRDQLGEIKRRLNVLIVWMVLIFFTFNVNAVFMTRQQLRETSNYEVQNSALEDIADSLESIAEQVEELVSEFIGIRDELHEIKILLEESQ